MEAHNAAVSAIVTFVKYFYQTKQFLPHLPRLNKQHEALPPPKLHRTVSTAPLSRILQINMTTKTVLIEPNVPVDCLMQATLKHGLVPPVVMEFLGITVGGGYAGASGESKLSIGLTLCLRTDGEGVRASPTDLFEGAAGAAGTLVIVVLLEVRLIEATRFAKTTYKRVESVQEATRELLELTERRVVDHVDGSLFNLDLGLVITGKMADEGTEGVLIRSFSKSGNPWFYPHAKDIATNKSPKEAVELIPLDEYLFRYDRGGFWVGDSIFKYFIIPFKDLPANCSISTCIRERCMSISKQAASQTHMWRRTWRCRMPLRISDYADKEFGIYLLWLCPLRQDTVQSFHPHNKIFDEAGRLIPMLNIGLWGLGPLNDEAFLKKNLGLEDMLRKPGGMKWLYPNTIYTEKTFWDIYNGE